MRWCRPRRAARGSRASGRTRTCRGPRKRTAVPGWARQPRRGSRGPACAGIIEVGIAWSRAAAHGSYSTAGIELVVGGLLLDPELHQLDGDDLAVPLPEDTQEVAVLGLAVPGHDEVADAVRGHRRARLCVGRVRVDPELRAERRARGDVALPEHAFVETILGVARPRHDEVADAVLGHRGPVL